MCLPSTFTTFRKITVQFDFLKTLQAAPIFGIHLFFEKMAPWRNLLQAGDH